jgi:hypothetical protein
MNQLKADRNKRDPNGGGPRTYVAWLRSLGLLWEGDDEKLYLTLAGEAIVEGNESVLEIMSRQILHYQFPSSFSTRTFASRVTERFTVRPFVFLLQLLLDERLGGYLTQKDDVAKIVLCYGVDNSQACVDDVIERILRLRADGDESLESEYLDLFRSKKSKEATRDKLFENLNDIANTVGNWLSHTQLVTRARGGIWTIPPGAERAARQVVDSLAGRPLIPGWDHEERFQRRFGLTPGKRKDNRSVGAIENVSDDLVRNRAIIKEYTEYATSHLVLSIDDELVSKIAASTASTPAKVREVLRTRVKTSYGGFFMTYTELAQGSTRTAREFERATAEIFSKVFGFRAKHIGSQPLRPDVLLYSDTERYGAIVDTKAYSKAYALTHAQRGVMRNYVTDYPAYRLGDGDLAFFAYVAHSFGPNIDEQVAEVSARSGDVPGAAISAHELVLMCRHHLQTQRYSHVDIRRMFSGNKSVSLESHERSLEEMLAAATT